MGCDYYIINQIKIEYVDDTEDFNMECNIKRGYFDEYEFDFNSDCSDYEENVDNFIQKTYLTVSYKPKVIFDKCAWIDEKYEDKYEHYLHDLKIDLSNIFRMTKHQVRRLR